MTAHPPTPKRSPVETPGPAARFAIGLDADYMTWRLIVSSIAR